MKRKCTDVLFCIFFFLFIGGMVAVFVFSFKLGHPKMIVQSWDNDRMGCGLNETTLEYPALYWPEMPGQGALESIKVGNFSGIWSVLNKGVCVKECPGANSTVPIDCKPTSYMISQSKSYVGCQYYFDGTTTKLLPLRYPTKKIGGFCLPDVTKIDKINGLVESAMNSFKEAFFASAYGKKTAAYFMDIMMCWPVLLASTGVALVVSYIFLFIMRCMGGGLVWLMIFLTIGTLGGGGGYCWYLRSAKFTPADDPTYKYLAIASYVLWGLAGLIFLFMLCCCGAIKLGIAVMKASAKFIGQNLRIMLLPIFSYVFITVWGLLWFFGGLYLYTIGYAAPRKGFEFSTEIMWDKHTKPAIVYYIMGFFWVTAFILGCTQFIIAAAAAIWYFTQGSDAKPDCVGTGFKWLLKYHLGTIAFGSCIIAIVQTIRVIFEYYRR